MIATVRALAPAQFEEWLAHQKQMIQESNEAAKASREKLGTQEGASAVEAATGEST
jgi:heme/copper-type cytochrome/quinol oxidase subunit 2